MPTKLAQTLHQGNGETLTGTVSDEGTGAPRDLTGVTLTMYIKPSRATDDDDDAVVTLTTGDGITHGEDTGSYAVTIPASDLATAGNLWYRVDASSGGDPRTVAYGPLKVLDL